MNNPPSQIKPIDPALPTLVLAIVGLIAAGCVLLHRDTAYDALIGSKPVTFRIDPNRADADTLCLLPNVGPPTARRILADRQAYGPFTSPNDLARVNGIGPKTVAAMTPWIELSSADHMHGLDQPLPQPALQPPLQP